MKPRTYTLLSFLSGLVLMLLLTTHQASAVAAPSNAACDTGRAVNVSGSAVINVIPDQVTIQLGVTSNDASPAGVQSKNTTAIKKVIAAIRQLGIADKDISTDYYIVQPLYADYDSLDIKGYRIHNTIAVTLKDASKVSDVLTTALTAGANEVIDVRFATTQLRRYRDDARAQAMKAAQEKAQALATVAGAQVGCVLDINENSWSYYGGGWWGGRYQPMAQNVVQNATGNAQPPSSDGPIALGQIAVQAEVQARFSLK